MEIIGYSSNGDIEHIYKSKGKSPVAIDKMIELIKSKAIIADIEYGEGVLENALQTVKNLYEIVKTQHTKIYNYTGKESDLRSQYYLNTELQAINKEVLTASYNNKVLFDGDFKLSVMVGKNVEDKLDITLPCLTTDYLFGSKKLSGHYVDRVQTIEALKSGMESLILTQKEIKILQQGLEAAKAQAAIKFLESEYSGSKDIIMENILKEAEQENTAKFSPSYNIDTDKLSNFLSAYTYKDTYRDNDNSALDQYIYNNPEIREATKHFITKDEAEQLYSNEDIYKYIWELNKKKFITSEILELIFTQKILSVQSQMGSSSRDNREVYNIKFQANMDAIGKLAAKLKQDEENDETFKFFDNNAGYSNSGNTEAKINILEEDKAREASEIMNKANDIVEQNLLLTGYLIDKAHYMLGNNLCKTYMLYVQSPYRFFYKYNESGEVDKNKLYITDEDVINLGNVYCDVAKMQNLVLYQYATALKTMQNDYEAHSAAYKAVFQNLGGVISDIASKLYWDESVKDNLSDYSGFLKLMRGDKANNPALVEFREQSLYDQMLQISSATENMKKDILIIQAELMEAGENYIELSNYIPSA